MLCCWITHGCFEFCCCISSLHLVSLCDFGPADERHLHVQSKHVYQGQVSSCLLYYLTNSEQCCYYTCLLPWLCFGAVKTLQCQVQVCEQQQFSAAVCVVRIKLSMACTADVKTALLLFWLKECFCDNDDDIRQR